MSRVIYLVAASEAKGIAEAEARGWVRIARGRFVTPGKDDIRLVCRLDDLAVLPGGTPMLKAPDYDDGPDSDWEMARWAGDERRVGEKTRFDKFVAEGHGRWVEV